MFVNSISFKPSFNTQPSTNINFKGSIGFVYPDSLPKDEFVSQKLSKHEQNIINVMGQNQYDKLCNEIDETEKMVISNLLGKLDDNSIIIIVGDSNIVVPDLDNFLTTEPNVNKNIKKAYVVRNSNYEYPVFITTSKQTSVHGDPMFMVHSKGKLRVQSPWWSPAQTRNVKNTRYLTYGDVVRVEGDGHLIKLEKPTFDMETPRGVFEQKIDDFV